MFMDVLMCECIVCMKEKANKSEFSESLSTNTFLLNEI
jgi:hypothetical protein